MKTDAEWQKRREEILERDNYTCQYRGEAGDGLHVHHFKPRTEFERDDLADHDGNLIALCGSCHQILENYPERSQRRLIRRKQKDVSEPPEQDRIQILIDEDEADPFTQTTDGDQELQQADRRYSIRNRMDRLEEDIELLRQAGEDDLVGEFYERFGRVGRLQREVADLREQLDED